MSLYGSESPSYFSEALSSIYNAQTLKPNQIVLVLDGPLPAQLLAEVVKARESLGSLLTIVELPTNRGLATALNIGLEHCLNEWVFRMDTDDIALPNRFLVQANFLQAHPDIDVLGALMEEFDTADSSYSVVRRVPEKHEDITKYAKSRNPINHPVCCFKKTIVTQTGGYPVVYPEDYFLWVKLIQAGHRFHNLQEPLLKMRTGEAFIKRRGVNMLKGELNTYRYMRETGFINRKEFLVTATLRAIIRIAPGWLKILAYKHLR